MSMELLRNVDLLRTQPAEIKAAIGTIAEKGLTFSEVSELRKIHGLNKLESEEKVHILIKFLSTFKDPLILMLLSSCALSTMVGQVASFLSDLFVMQSRKISFYHDIRNYRDLIMLIMRSKFDSMRMPSALVQL